MSFSDGRVAQVFTLTFVYCLFFFKKNLSRENGAKPEANSLFDMYKLSNNAEEGRKNYFKL